MYTLDELRLLPYIVTSVSSKLGQSMSDMDVIIDTLKSNGRDNEDLIRETLLEFLCCAGFLITLGEFFSLDLENLLYKYPLEVLPLYLNKDDDTPEALQSIVAMWRLKIGK